MYSRYWFSAPPRLSCDQPRLADRRESAKSTASPSRVLESYHDSIFSGKIPYECLIDYNVKGRCLNTCDDDGDPI